MRTQTKTSKLFNVFMSADVDAYVSPVLHSGYVGEGDTVKEFETNFGLSVHNALTLAVNSGTSAITLALKLSGVGPGDLVISTPMTCLATNEPILILILQPATLTSLVLSISMSH